MRSRSKDDAVGLKAFSITTPKFPLGVATLINQETSEAKSSRAPLAKAVFDEAALPGKYLDRKLAAVFASHYSLDTLEEDRTDAAIIVKLFAAVVNSDPGARAKVLVVCTFIGILKSPPPAHVIDQDCLEIGGAGLHF